MRGSRVLGALYTKESQAVAGTWGVGGMQDHDALQQPTPLNEPKPGRRSPNLCSSTSGLLHLHLQELGTVHGMARVGGLVPVGGGRLGVSRF